MDAAPISIDELLTRASEAKASDLHVVPGAQPIVRVHGDLVPLADTQKLSGEVTRDLLYRILSTEQQKQLEVGRQLDFSYGVPGLARFSEALSPRPSGTSPRSCGRSRSSACLPPCASSP